MNIAVWLRHALYNLRSGLKGFWIFLTCLTLGVGAIAIIGSLGQSMERGLMEQGQPLMGGDVEFSLLHREVSDPEKAFIEKQGTLSRVATLRAMSTTGVASTLVEIKAADDNYPLYGSVTIEGGGDARRLRQGQFQPYPVLVDPLLLGRLELKLNDTFKIGEITAMVAGVISTEPDRISDGIVFGPRVLMSHQALEASGLVQPGSLITWRYRVKLTDDTSLAAAKKVVTVANEQFKDAGWRVRARDQAAQGADRFIERLSYFMTLVSIAALVIGGAGIANAVAAFVSRRLGTIATLKCLGISNRDIMGTFLIEIMLVGTMGIAMGCALGAIAPLAIKTFFGSVLPLPISDVVEWNALGFAALLGFLVTLAFAIWPLSRVSNIQGASLFRSNVMPAGGWPKPKALLASLTALALAAALILLNFDNLWMTSIYLAGLLGSFLALGGLAFLLVKLFSRLALPQNVLLRHAVQSLYRPGSNAISVILALGLGLTLFVMLALTDGTLSRELRAGIPEKAPAFFFLDVRNEELPAFKSKLLENAGVSNISNAPMLRGRITKVRGIAAADVKVKPEASWALRGDRGLTYSDELPTGSSLTSGAWWSADYSGKPLVSMSKDIAEGMDLKIGDMLTVNVLGRDIDAEIANLREVNWRSMGINFVLVFTPNTLKAAPHSHLVTIDMTNGDEAGLLNRVAQAYPSVTSVRVKDALATVTDLLNKMLIAVRSASAVTLLTGVLVLAGALAAGLSSRSFEAVVLKTYGATRAQLLTAFAIEYGLLGLVSAIFGIVVGSLAAWFLALFVLEMPWVFSPTTAIITALASMVLTTVAGLIVTYRALSAKPADYLRND